MNKIIKQGNLGVFLFILVLLILLLSIIIQRQPEKEIQPTEFTPRKFMATEILDGDTFLANGGEKIRLIGIDTPEAGEDFYREAKEKLSKLIMGKSLYAVFDSRQRDRYDRLLVYLYADSLFVNEKLLLEGFANTYFFPKEMLRDDLRDVLCNAQNKALNAKRGIWATNNIELSNRYFGKPHTFRFHRPECNAVTGSDTNSMIKADNREFFLEQCYSPCRNCKP